ncbi:hypothetical protein AB6805_18455 [Chitinophaga sp. RCC_12]|uniref:hypothetical protein n=1 Tax=Chitinophaga sp. RCC_12 TaxID=3239226 RepID=UPI003525B4DF
MKLYYIVDGIVQGLLTVICAINITHLFVFSRFSLPPYLIFILLAWQFSAGVINFTLRKTAPDDRMLRRLQCVLFSIIGTLFLLVHGNNLGVFRSIDFFNIYGWLVYASFYIVLPALILSVTALTIRRCIVTLRSRATSTPV